MKNRCSDRLSMGCHCVHLLIINCWYLFLLCKQAKIINCSFAKIAVQQQQQQQQQPVFEIVFPEVFLELISGNFFFQESKTRNQRLKFFFSFVPLANFRLVTGAYSREAKMRNKTKQKKKHPPNTRNIPNKQTKNYSLILFNWLQSPNEWESLELVGSE